MPDPIRADGPGLGRPCRLGLRPGNLRGLAVPERPGLFRLLIALAMLAAGWTVSGAAPAAIRHCRPIPEAADIVAALNDYWRRSVRLCESVNPRVSASAYPDAGIVRANPDWLADIADQYGSSAVTGILAHEWAHMIQGGAPGPAAELQADCLAGAFMRHARFGPAELDRFLLVSLDSGDPYRGETMHGTGRQRRAAILRGYVGSRGQAARRLAAFCRA